MCSHEQVMQGRAARKGCGSRGAYFARRRSLRRLVSTRAAPPTRKRQLGMSMALLLPKYQFCVMFSVDTTSARLLGYTCTQCLNQLSLAALAHLITVTWHEANISWRDAEGK